MQNREKNSTSHTPGPWKTVMQKHPENGLVIGIAPPLSEKRWVCRITPQPNLELAEEFANANLIAAAPELLESLSIAVMVIEAAIKISGINGDSSVREEFLLRIGPMKEVVKKARGES